MIWTDQPRVRYRQSSTQQTSEQTRPEGSVEEVGDKITEVRGGVPQKEVFSSDLHDIPLNYEILFLLCPSSLMVIRILESGLYRVQRIRYKTIAFRSCLVGSKFFLLPIKGGEVSPYRTYTCFPSLITTYRNLCSMVTTYSIYSKYTHLCVLQMNTIKNQPSRSWFTFYLQQMVYGVRRLKDG